MTKAPNPAPETAQLEAQIAQLHADVARLTETLSRLAQSGGAALVGAMGESAEQMQEKAKAGLAGLKAGAEPTLADARAFAREKPLTALGYAAIAGLIFGLLFGRR